MRRRHVLGPCTDTPSNRHLPFSRAGWHVVLVQEVHNPPEEPVIPLGGIHTAPDQVIERVLVPVVVVCQQDLVPLLRSCSWRASGQGAGAALGSSAFMAPLIASSRNAALLVPVASRAMGRQAKTPLQPCAAVWCVPLSKQ